MAPDPILSASANGVKFWPRRTSGGGGNGTTDLAPAASSRGAAAVASTGVITEGICDLSLNCTPPPGKIRRRNALPSSDLFLEVRELRELVAFSKGI